MRLDAHRPLAMAVYADALADWSLFEEAESLFQKAIKRDSECVLAIRTALPPVISRTALTRSCSSLAMTWAAPAFVKAFCSLRSWE
jgi:hypothetical protein